MHECWLWGAKRWRQAYDILFSDYIERRAVATVGTGRDDVKNRPKSYCVGLWGDTRRNLTVNLSEPLKTPGLWNKKIKQGMWECQFSS